MAGKRTVSRLTQFSAIEFKPVAPDSTSIKDLALTPKGQALLTPSAAKLTKADLLMLNKNPEEGVAKLHLSVSDVNSIKKAFSQDLRVSAKAKANGGTSVTVASCCTPCCCAAAVPIEAAIQ